MIFPPFSLQFYLYVQRTKKISKKEERGGRESSDLDEDVPRGVKRFSSSHANKECALMEVNRGSDGMNCFVANSCINYYVVANSFLR